jgi:enediyne biosynthesis protein E7
MTTAVLAETLRLWPPSWMFSRRVEEPLTLGGRTVSAGTMCLISPALLHRNPPWWSELDRGDAAVESVEVAGYRP